MLSHGQVEGRGLSGQLQPGLADACKAVDGCDDNATIDASLGASIKALWADPAIQVTVSKLPVILQKFDE
jgi:hypothetical protein